MVQLTSAWTWFALAAGLGAVRGADWYERAVFYQVDIATFKDGDGDGVGDILGLTQELKYIRSLGAEAVILSSPNDALDSVTNNYDPHFDSLITEANKIDLKVVVTLPRLVVSELSDWFRSSVDRSLDKDDIILWRNSDPSPDKLTWVRSDARGEYYAVEGASGRACLRGAHAAVRAELARLAGGWLARGAAGLLLLPACESAPHLATELAMLTTDYYRMHGGTKRIAIVDGTASFAAGREYLRAGGDALVAGGALLGPPDARDLKHRIDRWLTYLPARHTPLWMIFSLRSIIIIIKHLEKDPKGLIFLHAPEEGHAGERGIMEDLYVSEAASFSVGEVRCAKAGRYGASSPLLKSGESVQEARLVGIFSALALLLPGSAIIPQGSELGQGPNKPWPLDSLDAGAKAHLEFFLTLIQTRKTPTVSSDGLEIKILSDDVLAFVRFLEGEATFAVAVNVGQVSAEADLSAFYGLGEEMSASRGRVHVRAAPLLPGEPLLLRGGPRACGGPGPVDKITGKLSEAFQKVNKYFNW